MPSHDRDGVKIKPRLITSVKWRDVYTYIRILHKEFLFKIQLTLKLHLCSKFNCSSARATVPKFSMTSTRVQKLAC